MGTDETLDSKFKPKKESDVFEKKKKKPYEYEALFEKEKGYSDAKLKQVYMAAQGYKSANTRSGSKTSLDHDLTSSISPSSSKIESKIEDRPDDDKKKPKKDKKKKIKKGKTDN